MKSAPSMFDGLSAEEVVRKSQLHVQGMERLDIDDVWVSSGMEHLVIQTIGRKSGNEHKVALPFWTDLSGNRVVVASFMGAPKHPDWYLNITDEKSNPTVRVRVRKHEYECVPMILGGSEYQRTWRQLTHERVFYQAYQDRCSRTIPLIVLPERGTDGKI